MRNSWRKTRYRLVVSGPASQVIHLTEVGSNVLSLIHSNTVQATDSNHHRLSDKVNCDLTLACISVLLPVGDGEKIGGAFNISVFISSLML